MDKSEHISWNEKMAKKYDIDRFHNQTSSVVRYVEGRRIRIVAQLVDPAPNERVLEVGCGSGRVLGQFSSGRLHGIDLSRHLLAKARKKLGKRVALKFGDAEKIPYPSDYFDKVYCTEVLEHLRHPKRAIDEICRVGKPGAIAVITIPNEHLIDDAKDFARRIGLGFLLKNVAKKGNEWHLHYFDLKMLLGLTEGKMRLLTLRAIPNKFFPLHYIAKFRILRPSRAPRRSSSP